MRGALAGHRPARDVLYLPGASPVVALLFLPTSSDLMSRRFWL